MSERRHQALPLGVVAYGVSEGNAPRQDNLGLATLGVGEWNAPRQHVLGLAALDSKGTCLK